MEGDKSEVEIAFSTDAVPLWPWDYHHYEPPGATGHTNLYLCHSTNRCESCRKKMLDASLWTTPTPPAVSTNQERLVIPQSPVQLSLVDPVKCLVYPCTTCFICSDATHEMLHLVDWILYGDVFQKRVEDNSSASLSRPSSCVCSSSESDSECLKFHHACQKDTSQCRAITEPVLPPWTNVSQGVPNYEVIDRVESSSPTLSESQSLIAHQSYVPSCCGCELQKSKLNYISRGSLTPSRECCACRKPVCKPYSSSSAHDLNMNYYRVSPIFRGQPPTIFRMPYPRIQTLSYAPYYTAVSYGAQGFYAGVQMNYIPPSYSLVSHRPTDPPVADSILVDGKSGINLLTSHHGFYHRRSVPIPDENPPVTSSRGFQFNSNEFPSLLSAQSSEYSLHGSRNKPAFSRNPKGLKSGSSEGFDRMPASSQVRSGGTSADELKIDAKNSIDSQGRGTEDITQTFLLEKIEQYIENCEKSETVTAMECQREDSEDDLLHTSVQDASGELPNPLADEKEDVVIANCESLSPCREEPRQGNRSRMCQDEDVLGEQIDVSSNAPASVDDSYTTEGETSNIDAPDVIVIHPTGRLVATPSAGTDYRSETNVDANDTYTQTAENVITDGFDGLKEESPCDAEVMEISKSAKAVEVCPLAKEPLSTSAIREKAVKSKKLTRKERKLAAKAARSKVGDPRTTCDPSRNLEEAAATPEEKLNVSTQPTSPPRCHTRPFRDLNPDMRIPRSMRQRIMEACRRNPVTKGVSVMDDHSLSEDSSTESLLEAIRPVLQCNTVQINTNTTEFLCSQTDPEKCTIVRRQLRKRRTFSMENLETIDYVQETAVQTD